MLNVSAAFKTAVGSDSRSVKGAVIVHFLGEQTYPFATATATSQYDAATPPSQSCNGRISQTDYSCEGYVPASLASPQKGWWSAQLSDANGALATPEVLTVTYTSPLLGGNFWLLGILGYYPIDFLVERQVGGLWETVANVIGNTKYEWSQVSTVKLVQAVRVTITKIAPALRTLRIIQFGLVSTVVFEGANIVDMSLLEEISSEAGHPIGNVSANEFDVELVNLESRFTARNTVSPFYSMLLSSVMMHPYIGIETSVDVFEYVPLGKFSSGDWNAPSVGTGVTIVGHDKLYNLMSKPVPEIPIILNTTIGALFAKLFDSIGLVGYYIDPSLTQPIAFGFIPTGKFGETAQALAKAGNCYVFVSKLDILTVRPLDNLALPVASFTDSSVITVDNPQAGRTGYNSVSVNCSIPTVQKPDIVAELTGITIPVGETIFNNVAFKDGPIYKVSQVILIGNNDARVVDFSWSPWSITLKLISTIADVVSIVVYGHRISGTSATVVQSIKTTDGTTLSVDSDLIQSPVIAASYANVLASSLQDPLAMIYASVRGNPSVELLDIVTISNATGKFPSVDSILLTSKLTFDGGLNADLSTKAIHA